MLTKEFSIEEIDFRILDKIIFFQIQFNSDSFRFLIFFQIQRHLLCFPEGTVEKDSL